MTLSTGMKRLGTHEGRSANLPGNYVYTSVAINNMPTYTIDISEELYETKKELKFFVRKPGNMTKEDLRTTGKVQHFLSREI